MKSYRSPFLPCGHLLPPILHCVNCGESLEFIRLNTFNLGVHVLGGAGLLGAEGEVRPRSALSPRGPHSQTTSKIPAKGPQEAPMK